MRLIDVDVLIEEHCKGCSEDVRDSCKTDPVCATLMWFEDAPTIDAVPVVRCKDCTYRADPMECPMCFEEYTDLSEDEWDSIISDSTVDDGFCQHGKRKDGEG